jgi:hypothetical protein
MTPEQFCYWLNGFTELNKANPTTEQWNSIREHLSTVFKKVTPPVYRHNELIGEKGIPYPRIQDMVKYFPPIKPDTAIC